MADPTATAPILPAPPLSTSPTTSGVVRTPSLADTQAAGGTITAPNTSASSNPVIPVSTITDTTPLKLPAAKPSSGDTHAAAIAGIAQGQNALLNSTDAQNAKAQTDYNAQKSDLGSQISTYLGKSADQLNMENAAGIPGLRTKSSELTNQYLTQQGTYNAQYNAILNRPGGTMSQKAQEISDLQQQHGFELTDTAVKQSIAQNDYTNAQNLVNHQIDIKYAPMKDAIDYGMQFLAQNKDILTSKQQNSFAASLAVQNQMYTQGAYYDHLNSDTKVQMVKDAAAQGAPADVQQAIWSAPDIGSAAASGGQYLKNGNYTVTQTGIDQNTGLPIYSKFNPKTGAMEPLNLNGALGTTGTADSGPSGTVVNGYQMGATTSFGAYASSTSTQVNNIKATTTKIQMTVGPITDNNTAQLALNTVAPKSPVSGAMVMSSAQKYGVDPATIIGVMQAETQSGTDGSKGSKEGNWGNVGNTDSLMSAGGSVKMKPQDGVDAIAKNLAMRKVQPGQADPTQPVNTDGLTNQQKAQMVIKAAPQLLQPAMQTTATGDVYIDSSKVPANLEVMKQSYASKTGLPILNADQVATVQSADEARRNITEVIAPAWAEIAPSGPAGKIGLSMSRPFSQVTDSDFFAKNNTFFSNKENLAQQIRALSQSAPKGSLLATAETALPDNSGYLGKGTTYDTRKDGNMKMQRTLDLLNQTIKTFLPNAKPVSLDTTAPEVAKVMNVNGMNYVLQPNGKYIQQ